ncbi:hypothetical protein Celaphus_00007586 [Cervus elaphus hippelaphus]|uniref:CRNKL1 n=1 Tax=Cervus elaphus hippelaphus TaxID=46360 RepID=A0A212CC43_CEREH|nr:hypothetical protein Celaphus_00007586 [Cervus elaphus hippelaphus]
MAASTAAGKQRIPKVAKVKNKAPAEVQITAEQLLREAKERELELLPPPPQQKITDEEELNDYKLRKRKTFEDNIRKNRTVISNWIKYAQWEESLKEIQRARSIYERALDVDYRNITLWLKYAEMEMKNRQVNHARNIWDRAITTLPRVNQFWYKYTYMEEMLGNIAGARQVFERWMEWRPEEQAWHSYINFELRYKEVDRARTIYERYILRTATLFCLVFPSFHSLVLVHPDVKNWIKYARFEEKHGYFAHARKVYERAVEFFGDEHMDEHLYVAFAKFEENQKEANPHNYDAWFDYLRLVESDAEAETVREVYERAIANVPPVQEKRHWKRYIYLWINYALYEELEAKGTSIGKCPKNKLFKGYIELELQLREFDRCRKLYEKFLEFGPENCTSWIKFAELETILGDIERARAIYELAISQPRLDMPEVLWKSYIDFEIEQEETERTRNLYRRLLQRTQHVKRTCESQDFGMLSLYTRPVFILHVSNLDIVWISFAQFELSSGKEGSLAKCRQIYEEANKTMRNCEEKEERLMLLESWRSFEDEFGTASDKERVDKLMPEKVKKRRKVQADDGVRTEPAALVLHASRAEMPKTLKCVYNAW